MAIHCKALNTGITIACAMIVYESLVFRKKKDIGGLNSFSDAHSSIEESTTWFKSKQKIKVMGKCFYNMLPERITMSNLARVDSSSPLCWSQAQEKREGWKPHFCKTTHTQNPQRNTTHRHQPRNSDLFKFFRGRTPGLIAWAVAMNKPDKSIAIANNM
nr:unnamed protein product [Callosobruchus chinensis]